MALFWYNGSSPARDHQHLSGHQSTGYYSLKPEVEEHTTSTFYIDQQLTVTKLQVLTAHQSNRVCNALALLQCVASHPDTRFKFDIVSHPDPRSMFRKSTAWIFLIIIPHSGRLFCWRTYRSTSTHFSTLSPRPGILKSPNFVLSSGLCHSVLFQSICTSFCDHWACCNDSRPFEYLRLTSLGVIGALVKTDEQEVNL